MDNIATTSERLRLIAAALRGYAHRNQLGPDDLIVDVAYTLDEMAAGDGCNDAAGSKVAQVRTGLDHPDQSQSNSG